MSNKTRVIQVESKEHWNNIVIDHQKNHSILVVTFGASYCGPCKALKPKLDGLSNGFDDNVVFVKVDIEEQRDIADKFDITSIPTTLIIRDTQITKTVVGADLIGITVGIQNNLTI
jgi:thioredoxin 1